MTKSRVRLIAGTVTVAALIGIVLEMRSTAYKDGCEVYDAYSSRLIRHLRGPRTQDSSNGGILLGNADWIYTQKQRGEVQRWRVR